MEKIQKQYTETFKIEDIIKHTAKIVDKDKPAVVNNGFLVLNGMVIFNNMLKLPFENYEQKFVTEGVEVLLLADFEGDNVTFTCCIL